MILDDPELPGVSAVLFDEFHERSLDGDFGLALALDVQGALRPDLRLLVMSATLDGARVAKLLGDAPVIESAGRSFPVEIRYEERAAGYADRGRHGEGDPRGGRDRDRQRARLPARPARDRAHGRAPRRPAAGELRRRPALRPARRQGAGCGDPAPRRPARRKVVLATSIAETSITIDGVRVVIDSGLSRLPRYEPATGLTRLETVRVSRASADQRAGRAGRTRARRRDQAVARRADGGAARLHAARNSAGRSLRPAARLRRLRRRRPDDAALPRPAAGPGARRGARAASRPRRDRRSRPADRSGRSDAQARAAGAAGAYGRRGCSARTGAGPPPSLRC